MIKQMTLDQCEFHANRDNFDGEAECTLLLFGIQTHMYPWEHRDQVIGQDFSGEKHRVYTIISSINWAGIYKSADFWQKGVIHPFMLVIEAKNRNLPVYDLFFEAVDTRYRRRYGKSILEDDRSYNKSEYKYEKSPKPIKQRLPQHIAKEENSKIRFIKLLLLDIYKTVNDIENRGTSALGKVYEAQAQACGIDLSDSTITALINDALKIQSKKIKS